MGRFDIEDFRNRGENCVRFGDLPFGCCLALGELRFSKSGRLCSWMLHSGV